MTLPSPSTSVHLYDVLGIKSRRLAPQSGETVLAVRGAVLSRGGLRIAPIGLAFEHGVATYAFDAVVGVPTNISVHLRDRRPAPNVVRWVTQTVRAGRTAIFTEGSLEAVTDPHRRIGYGSIIWSVIGPAPHVEPSARPDGPPLVPGSGSDLPLTEVIGLRRDADDVWSVPSIRAGMEGPGGVLHAGVYQVLAEEAALGLAHTLSRQDVRVVDCSHHFTAPGKVGPFAARAKLLCRETDGADVEVVIRDEGNSGRVCAFSQLRAIKVDELHDGEG
jgi:acyl-coenzyme A thioesterase PaaI-like protein